MPGRHAAVKKSVTIDRDLLERLRVLAALDAQQALVEEWEAEDGPLDEEELRPFLEAALQAQLENTMRILAQRSAAST